MREGYDDEGSHWALGGYRVYILMKESKSVTDVQDEVLELIRKFNVSDMGDGWKLDLVGQPELYWHSTFRLWSNVAVDWGQGDMDVCRYLYGITFCSRFQFERHDFCPYGTPVTGFGYT